MIFPELIAGIATGGMINGLVSGFMFVMFERRSGLIPIAIAVVLIIIAIVLFVGYTDAEESTTPVEMPAEPPAAGVPDSMPANSDWRECADAALGWALAKSYRHPDMAALILSHGLAVCDREFPEAAGPCCDRVFVEGAGH